MRYLMKQKWISYGIDIVPGEDDVLILCAAIVIDLCCHPDKD